MRDKDTPKRTIRFLSGDDVRRCLPMADAIEAMRDAFVQLSTGDAVAPVRTRIQVSKSDGAVLFMPAYLPSDDRLGLKVVSLFEGNRKLGLPFIHALVVVVDGTNGRPLAVLDGEHLTALRTGAASGLATDLLARKDARVAALFGAGVQGRTQIEAVSCVRRVDRAFVFDTDEQMAEEFAREMTERLSVQVRVAASPAEAVQDADVICTATTSEGPVFSDADLKAGVHINAVGSYRPDVQEIPSETVQRAKVVVDHRPAALSEAGDLVIPMRDGSISKDHVYAELGEIAAERKPCRTAEDEITLFKSVGVAVQDLAAAEKVLAAAERLDLGVDVPW